MIWRAIPSTDVGGGWFYPKSKANYFLFQQDLAFPHGAQTTAKLFPDVTTVLCWTARGICPKDEK